MKLYHYEQTVDKLEKERASLQARATLAEEQLAVLQEHLHKYTLDSSRKISALEYRVELLSPQKAVTERRGSIQSMN